MRFFKRYIESVLAKELGVSVEEYRLASNVTDEEFWSRYGEQR